MLDFIASTSLSLKSLRIPCEFRLSQRSRRLTVRVSLKGVEIIYPSHLCPNEIDRFLKQKEAWIVRRYTQYLSAQQTSIYKWPDNFTQGASLPYQGQRYTLHIETQTFPDIKFEPDDLLITLSLPAFSLSDSDSQRQIKSLLKIGYHRQALIAVENALTHFSEKMALYPKAYSVKTLKSLWGSLSSQNKVSINVLLILAPPPVLAYVVVHELAHLRYRGHGPRFWKLVENFFPDFKTQEAWLKKYTPQLLHMQNLI